MSAQFCAGAGLSVDNQKRCNFQRVGRFPKDCCQCQAIGPWKRLTLVGRSRVFRRTGRTASRSVLL